MCDWEGVGIWYCWREEIGKIRALASYPCPCSLMHVCLQWADMLKFLKHKLAHITPIPLHLSSGEWLLQWPIRLAQLPRHAYSALTLSTPLCSPPAGPATHQTHSWLRPSRLLVLPAWTASKLDPSPSWGLWWNGIFSTRPSLTTGLKSQTPSSPAISISPLLCHLHSAYHH